LRIGQAVEIGIRPEHFTAVAPNAMASAAQQADGVCFEGDVVLVEQLGESHLVYMRTDGGEELVMRGSALTRARPGDRAAWRAPAQALHVFDADGRAHRRLQSLESLEGTRTNA
jgi:multiple sugar transport system ATP-binding protein